jgi:hypothetical protein
VSDVVVTAIISESDLEEETDDVRVDVTEEEQEVGLVRDVVTVAVTAVVVTPAAVELKSTGVSGRDLMTLIRPSSPTRTPAGRGGVERQGDELAAGEESRLAT